MSRTLHLFGTDWCAMMVPIQVIRWYRMQCYDGTDSCAIVVPNRRYCHIMRSLTFYQSTFEQVMCYFFMNGSAFLYSIKRDAIPER